MTVETSTYLAIAALVIGILALLLAFWVLLRARRLSRLGTFRPQMPEDLQATVAGESSRLDQLTLRVDELTGRLPAVENRSSISLQRVGVVRFNPFEDTGGQQSFAVALLDARGSGLVISSLHSRQQTRVYLKQITEGRSETQLGDEEAEAIRQALAGR